MAYDKKTKNMYCESSEIFWTLNKFLADRATGKTPKQTENEKKPVTQRFPNAGPTPYLKLCIVILSISNGNTYVYVATLTPIHTVFYFWMCFYNAVCCKYVIYAYISCNTLFDIFPLKNNPALYLMPVILPHENLRLMESTFFSLK